MPGLRKQPSAARQAMCFVGPPVQPEPKGGCLSRVLRQEHGTSSPRAVPGLCKQPAADEAAGWTRDQASAAKSEALAKAQRPPLPAESSR